MLLEFLITTLVTLLSASPFIALLVVLVFRHKIADILEALRERILSMRSLKSPIGDIDFGGEVGPPPKIPGTPEDKDIEDAEYTIISNPPELEKKNKQ